MSPSSRSRRRRDLVAQPVGDERVVYDPRTDSIHVLDPVAALLWDALGDELDDATLRQRSAALLGDGTPSEVDEALARALRELAVAGLLEQPAVLPPALPESPAPTGPPDRDAVLRLAAADAAPPDARTALRAANARLAAGDLIGAEAMLRAALAHNPADAHVLGNLGSVLFLAGRTAEAGSLYERALAVDSENSDTWSNLGNVRRREGRSDEASACYERALSLDPEHLDATSNLAALRLAQGRTDEAVALWRDGARRHPGDPAPVVALARCFAERGDLVAAETTLRDALAAGRATGELVNALGVVLQLAGRAAEARDVFREALRLAPSSTAARRNLAQLAAAAGDWEEVAAHTDALLARAPDTPEIRLLAAHARSALRDSTGGLALLEAGLELEASALACADELVRLHERAGRRAEATMVYARIAPRLRDLDLARWPHLAALRARAEAWSRERTPPAASAEN
jgi:tetratricopeptide (TPR) repeat protein